MIKFIDNAYIGGQAFTAGMIADFDPRIEADLIQNGDAVIYEVTGTAENAINAQHADTADLATSALSADTATTADHATTADTAETANSATTATTAQHADTAGAADTAGHATTADTATNATTAVTATTATTATTAYNANAADKATALILDSTALVHAAIGKPVESLLNFAGSSTCIHTFIDEYLELFTITAGTMGAKSILQIEPLWTYTSSANNKTCKVIIGGITIYNAVRTTSTKESPLIILANRNSLTSQIQPYESGYVTAGTGAPVTYAIDFSKDVLVQIIGRRVNVADTLKLEYCRVLHYVG